MRHLGGKLPLDPNHSDMRASGAAETKWDGKAAAPGNLNRTKGRFPGHPLDTPEWSNMKVPVAQGLVQAGAHHWKDTPES